MKFKTKLILGSVISNIVIIAISMLVVSYIVSKQNNKASNEIIKKSYNVILDDIASRQKKIMDATRQVAAMEGIGLKIKYIMRYKNQIKPRITRATYQELAKIAYNTCVIAGDVWKVYIYDTEGDIISFAKISESGSFFGYAEGFPSPSLQAVLLKPGENEEHGSWSRKDDPGKIELRFGKSIPESGMIPFEEIEQIVCLTSYAPIFGLDYNPDLDKMEHKQVGIVMAIQPMNDSFLRRLVKLTDMEINIFNRNGLVVGNIPEYSKLDQESIKDREEIRPLSSDDLTLNEIHINGVDYFHGLLPLYAGHDFVGAIASLYSKSIVQANTSEMIKNLLWVALCCILLVIPFVLLFSRSIVRPIIALRDAMRQLQKGQLVKQFDIKSKDEIGELSRSFHDMANQIQEHTKNLEKAHIDLRISEERYRITLDALDEGLYDWNIVEDTLFFSPSYFTMLGYEKNEFEHSMECYKKLLHPEDRERSVNTIQQFLSTGDSENEAEVRLRAKDGSYRWVLTKGRIVTRDRDGKPIRMVGTNVDITKQKELENELIQSHKMEAIGTLAGGIAHDFNNVLSSIIGFTELAIEDAQKGTAQENYLQQVYTASIRAKDLVWQILTFARETHEPTKPIQVDKIAKEVLKLMRSSIPTTIEIKQNINSESLIIGNPTQIHQIITNFCTNAAHAMDESGGILEVSVKDVSIDKASRVHRDDLRPGDYIEIKVSDTGVGIPSDIISSIYQPYFTTKAAGEGTGMGLAVVQGIVEKSGGKISVESRVGKGTTFSVFLPITKKQKVDHQYVQEKLPTGNERILFVDDEASIAKMGARNLESLGYTVTALTSSVDALEVFRSKPNAFDLVISDMTMPNMTGDILAVELMVIRSDIPVILCTGYSKKISDETASEIGIKAFAYKPIVKADLAKTVRKVLDEAKG